MKESSLHQVVSKLYLLTLQAHVWIDTLALNRLEPKCFQRHAADTVLPDAVCTNQNREIRRTFVFPQNPPGLNLQIQYGHPSICHATMLPCKCHRPSVLHGGTSVVPHIFRIREKTAMLLRAPAAEGFYYVLIFFREPTRPKAS